MAQSQYIDQSQKDKLEKICFNTQFPTPKETEKIKETSLLRLKEIDKQKEILKSWEGYDLVMRELRVYFGYSTEMINRYYWKKDRQYLVLAKEYFDVANKQIENIEGLEIEDRCLVGLSGLDIYQAGDKESKYLDYADNIFEEHIIKSEESIRVSTPICGLLVDKMLKITAKNKYMTSLNFISRILDEFYSDSKTNKITSEGAFFKSNIGTVHAWYKNIVENGLIVELIRN